MEKLIFKYLETNFKIFVGPSYQISMLDLFNNKICGHDIYYEVKNVFGIDEDTLDLIYETWFDNQHTKLHNEIVDICYDLHATNTIVFGEEVVIRKLSSKYITYLSDTKVS